MVEQQQQPQQQQQQPQQQQQQQQQSNALSTSPAKSHLATWWRQFKNSPKSISTDSISNRSTNQHYPGRYGGGNGSKYNDRPALNKPHSTNAVITSTMSNDLQHNKDFKSYRDSFLKSRNDFTGQVFGVPLSQSLSLASAEVIVQSELANFGRIPIVVAKCGAFLKQNGLYTSGIFRIAGNNKRIKELVYIFSTPPNYGTKFSNWDGFTVHDAASVLRRFLNNLTEPLIPLDHYETYREPLRSRVRILKHMKRPASAGSSKIDDLRRSTEDGSVTVPSIDSQSCEAVREEDEERKRKQLRHRKRLTRDIKAAIKEYEVLFSELSNDSKQLIVYLLDLLSLFAQQSDVNLMTARNLAAIFQPSILSHLDHDMDPQEYELSRFVIEFLIDYSYRLLPHLLKITKNEQAVLQRKVRHGSGGVQKEKPSSRSRVVSDNTGVTKVAPTNHPTLQATNGQSITISDIRKLPQISDLEGNMNQLNLNTSHSTPVTMLGNVTKVNDNEVKQPPVESASHSHEKQGQFISTHPPQALHQYPQHQKQMQQQTPHNYPPQQKPQHQYHQQQHINQHHPQQMQLPKLQTQLHGIQPLQQLQQHHLHKNAGTVPSSQSEIQNRKRFRPHSKSLSSAISPSDMISAWRTHQTSRFGKAVPLGSDTEGMSEYDEDEEIQGVHDEQSPSSNVSNTAIRNKTVSIHKPHNALRPVSVCSKATSRPCSFVINASEETNPISTSTKRSVSSHYPENLLSVPRSDDELEACQTSHPRNIEGDVYPRSDRPSRSNKRDSWFQRLRSRSRSASKK